jgi:hypothetical protein
MPPAWLLLILAALGGIAKDFIGVVDPQAGRAGELAGEASAEGGSQP